MAKIDEYCRALVRGCQHCKIFEAWWWRLCYAYPGICASRTGSCRLHQHRTTMELNKPPSIKRSWLSQTISQDTPWLCYQRSKGKTITQILYEWFISIFGTPAKLLSDWGTNFTSALVEELCSAFGIQKCRTTAYHAQCNGQVERFHQTLFRMIGKLSMDKKAQWELHLAELLQAFNSTWSAE